MDRVMYRRGTSYVGRIFACPRRREEIGEVAGENLLFRVAGVECLNFDGTAWCSWVDHWAMFGFFC